MIRLSKQIYSLTHIMVTLLFLLLTEGREELPITLAPRTDISWERFLVKNMFIISTYSSQHVFIV